MSDVVARRVQDAQDEANETAANDETAVLPVPNRRNPKSKIQNPKSEAVLVLLGFTALTIIMTWPVAPLFGRAINAFGDVVVQMTTMAWDAHALTTNPLGIFEAPFFY